MTLSGERRLNVRKALEVLEESIEVLDDDAIYAEFIKFEVQLLDKLSKLATKEI